MAKRNLEVRNQCDFELTMDIISGKWKGMIIYHLFKGAKRFVELRHLMPGITQRMLTLQLRELENDKIVLRKVYTQLPLRVEYSLTGVGEALEAAFAKINAWGKFYKAEIKKDT